MKKLLIALGVVSVAAITFTSVAFGKQSTTTKTQETVAADVINYVYVDIKGEVEVASSTRYKPSFRKCLPFM